MNRKEKCATCNQEIGLNRFKSKGGWLCPSCNKILQKEFGMKTLVMDPEKLREFMDNYKYITKGTVSESLDESAQGLLSIEFNGTTNGNNCTVSLDKDVCTIVLYKLLNLKKEIYSVNITDMILFAEKKSGRISKGIVGIRFMDEGKKKEFVILYDPKDQWRVDHIVQEIDSYYREIMSTCQQCGHVHYFNGMDVKEAKYEALLNLSKGMMAVGGFLPLAFLPDKETTDFSRCPSCGTRNVKLTEVVHKKR